MRGDWNEPIEVELGQIGYYRLIANTEQAAETLVHRWPVDRGRAYNKAVRVCLQVLDNNGDPSEAREAFLDAAKEAEVGTRRYIPYAVKRPGKEVLFGKWRSQ